MLDEIGGEAPASPPFSWGTPRKPVASPEMVRAAVRLAMARGLEQFQLVKPHGHTLSVVARGPSAEDTLGELTGVIASVNHAHDWLISKGVTPHACGMVDPVPWLAKQITPIKGVVYFVASQCHGSIFDKLKDSRVVVWHASQGEMYQIEDLVPPGTPMIPGGSSMSVRWLDLGYAQGFRDFHFHGFDCSYRGERHHVDEHDAHVNPPSEEVFGFRTHAGWLAQINDIFLRMERFKRDDHDPITVTLHGTGLAQHLWKEKFGNLVARSR